MAETTPILGLKKPTRGETVWDTPLRETIDLLDAHEHTDHNTDVDAHHDEVHDHTDLEYPSVALVRYVSPDGSNSNSGLSPGKAKATIQAAYDNLVAVAEAETGIASSSNTNLFCGRIVLLPGSYDVGSGVQCNRNRPLLIEGAAGAQINSTLRESSAIIKTTSVGATELFLVQGPVAVANGSGFDFRSLTFDMDHATLIAGIRAYSTLMSKVRDCQFQAETSRNAHAVWADIDTTRGNDNSWWLVEGNRARGVGLLKIPGASPSNNRWRVLNNIVNSGGAITAILDLKEVEASLFAGNNLESSSDGQAIGALLENCFVNTFLENAGEALDATLPFYKCVNSDGNLFLGGECRIPTSTTGVFIEFDANSGNNTIINPNIQAAGVSTVRKDKITDNTTGKTNLVMGARGFREYQGGLLLPVGTADLAVAAGALFFNSTLNAFRVRDNTSLKSLATLSAEGQQFTGGIAMRTKAGVPSDADFAAAPPSGTVVIDTTNSKIYVRIGGVWKATAALT